MSIKLTHIESTIDRISALLARPTVLLFLAILWLVLIFSSALGIDPDLFARLAVGKWVVEHGSVALQDPYAFTPTLPLWIDHEWLSGLLFYLIWDLGGDPLLFWIKVLFAGATIWLTIAAIRTRGGSLIPWLLFLILLDVSYIWTSTIRAQVFTYLFLPYLFLAIERFEKHRSKFLLYTLPLTFIIWANAHGGVVAGLGLFGIYSIFPLLRRKERDLTPAIITALSLLATLINPYGIQYWDYLLSASTMHRPFITEWAPLALPSGILTFLLIGFALFAFAAYRSHLSRYTIALLIAAAYVGIKHARLAAIFDLSCIIFLTPAFSAMLTDLNRKVPELTQKLSRATTLVLCTISLLAVQRFGALITSGPALDYSFYPVKAVDWLIHNQHSGDVLIDFNRGSYLLWRGYPNLKVSVDGRYEECYPEETVELVSAALNPKSSQFKESLAAVGSDYILLEVGATNAQTPDLFGTDWQKIYQDESFVILGR